MIAKEIGKPVRVQWSRADEHGWDPKGPPTLLDFRAALDPSGMPVAWESEIFIPDRPAKIAVPLVAAQLAGLPADAAHPGNIHQSLAIPYAVPNIKATAHTLAETPFRPSWIRTPGRMQNTFGNESFIDECAAAAGADPIEYRRKLLMSDRRGLELLDRLVELSAWKPRPRGAARSDGDVEQTVSRTLIEQLTFDRSKVTSVDWATYPILTFPDLPEVKIALIDRPAEKPWGAGEPTAAVVPSAIANAIFDATGARLRSVPFTSEKVLA